MPTRLVLILLAYLFDGNMKQIFLLFFLLGLSTTMAQNIQPTDSLDLPKMVTPTKKQPWKAAVQTIGLNIGVWAFDRYILNEDFARISIHTIKDNIRNGFVWDNDKFSTNLFAHPYHGSLYFNTARSNGMNFWESAPYALGGSLMWEIAAEREPPAINDLIATTLGGIALGEFTYRMSSLVLDDSKRGFPRFAREFLGTLLSPIRGMNRLISGDMWKVRNRGYSYHNYEQIPVKLSISSGNRYLANSTRLFRGEHNPYIKIQTLYGNPFEWTESQPYDYMEASITFGLSPNQPIINHVNLLGKIWSTPIPTKGDNEMMFGIFQHFNYYDSEKVSDDGAIPYKISEAASIGPGIISRFPEIFPHINLQQDFFLSGILLGGGLTDYYNVIDRNYNMGSGYSAKSLTKLEIGKWADINFKAHLYQIFTWKGYEKKDYQYTDPLFLNAQGDKGNTLFFVLNPTYNLRFKKHLKVSFEVAYYLRHTHYSYHQDVETQLVETRIGLTYEF